MKQSWKKILYILITVALVFTALSVVRYGDGEGPQEIERFDAGALASLQTVGCDVSVTEEGIRVTPKTDDSYFVLPTCSQPYNLVKLGLAEPFAKGVDTYVRDPEQTFMVKSYRMDDGRTLCFSPATQTSEGTLCVNVLLPMTLQSVSMHRISGTPVARVWNVTATVVLAVMLLLLAVLEKRLGYFSQIRTAVYGEIDRVRALWRAGKSTFAILYAVAQALTALFLLTVGAFVLLGLYTKTTLLTTFWFALAVLALQLIRQCLLSERAEPAKLFLTVAILVGIVMTYAMPPVLFVSWDDQIHYWQSYEVPNLLDPEMTLAETRLYVHRLHGIDAYIEDPMTLVYSLVQGDNITVEHSAYMPNPYTALSYIPMILAIGLLNLVNSDVVTLMVLCRLANLLAYALIIYFGIRKLKSGTYIFSAVCMLPTAFFLASTCNYDFWLTAWVVYALATVLSVLQTPGRKFTVAELVKLLVACFVACGPKAIYFFLFVPLLFLPRDRFESPRHAKRFRTWTLITMGLIVVLLLIPMFVLPSGYTDSRGGSDVNAGGQIAFILSHPFQYAWILLRFLGNYCSLLSLNSNSCFMAYLGGPHQFFGTLAGFLLLYCTFTDKREGDGYETMTRTRWTTLLACFGQVVLVATSLYVGYTPVGFDTINGCQYRYLFPILVPFLYFLAPKGLTCRINQRLQGLFVYAGLALSLMFTFFTVYLTAF